MSLKKFAFSIFVAAALVVAFHRASAETLPTVPVFEGDQKRRETGGCDTFHERLDRVENRTDILFIQLADYVRSVGRTFQEWHQILSPLEGTRTTFATGYFSPMTDSTANMMATSEVLSELSVAKDEDFESLRKETQTCFKDLKELDLALAQLEKFKFMHLEHLGTTADFVSLMQVRAANWAAVWRRDEGRELEVPAQYFSVLNGESVQYFEAGDLVERNSALVRAEWFEYRRRLQELASPLARR